jgi:hypothetical protein
MKITAVPSLPGTNNERLIYGVAPVLRSFRLALGPRGRERRAGPHLGELVNHFWLDRLERGNHGANIGLGSNGFQVPGDCARRSAMTHRAGA